MSRVLLLVASMASGLVLAGCLPVTSSSPLGTTVAATGDPQLTGMWKGKLGTSAGAAYVIFYPGHDGVQKIVLLAPPTANDEGGWMVFQARAATLGGNTYLDAREVEDSGSPPDTKLGHVPVLYKIGRDGFLVLYLVDETAARAAIARGTLAGTVEPGEFGDVTITANPAALDAFFSGSACRALFSKPLGTFQRVN
jgi:hypothetical protein